MGWRISKASDACSKKDFTRDNGAFDVIIAYLDSDGITPARVAALKRDTLLP
jgi:hypothetical protein